jgi:hypothetical protein
MIFLDFRGVPPPPFGSSPPPLFEISGSATAKGWNALPTITVAVVSWLVNVVFNFYYIL